MNLLALQISIALTLLACLPEFLRADENEPPLAWAEIQVIDAETQRGIPLVELETVNGLKFVTDNAGRVAIQEPGFLNREVYFTLRSHGYAMKKDGFGFAGAKITLKLDRKSVVEMQRVNLAERLCRLTGEGLFRDSLLLGYRLSDFESNGRGAVAGQDSIQAVVYHQQLYWFWGDTARMNYPLGLFRTAGAVSSVPDVKDPRTDPAHGVPYEYFVDKTGFARAMLPLPERPAGVIWIDGLCVVPDEQGKEHLVCHYSRRQGLGEEYEQGIAIYNDDQKIFIVAKQLPLNDTWRHPAGQSLLWENEGKKWLLFGNPAPNVRVPAVLSAVLEPARYEAYTCLQTAEKNSALARDPSDKPVWRWQTELPPLDAKQEFTRIKKGELKTEHARFTPLNVAEARETIQLHNGTVRWNAYRKRWIMLAGEIEGKTSYLGEVWYSEAEQPTGPFQHAVKVVTHDRQTFYNVCHHAFFDREAGRFIHFEGTYTNDFSGNSERTPRYHYNQVLYRLDLDQVTKSFE
jgi:hypothetical protein